MRSESATRVREAREDVAEEPVGAEGEVAAHGPTGRPARGDTVHEVALERAVARDERPEEGEGHQQCRR